ncbi:GAF domain-containing protein [Ferruginivarius sediminum]|uniref:GAF domain-containing protein n=1 Tax=Ferruginivarius sediminum TaxID=2661937 RepID=A0A369TII3_9PROT|nr:GAF domain-containing protein [Ferruginivarius sediminum]RDD62686.1 GAF domain-containing protein [Ferruginivarius sediminum]
MSEDDATGRLKSIVAEFGADGGTLHVLGSDGMLHLTAYAPEMPASVLETIRIIPVGKGMAGLAVERAAPVDACNIQTDDSGDVRPGARLTGLKGAIVVPVFDGERVVGALGIGNVYERTFTQDEVDRLLAAGREFVALSENHG